MIGRAGIQVRRGERRDLNDMTALYNRFVVDTIANFDVEPFTCDARLSWLEQFHPTGRHQLFVAEVDGAFAGYAGSMKHKEKRAYETSVETTIYVEPRCSRMGVGRALYSTLFDALKGADAHRALAGVALPNDASLALHRSFGFVEVGVFHEVGRKFGRYHDVLWLEKPL